MRNDKRKQAADTLAPEKLPTRRSRDRPVRIVDLTLYKFIIQP